MKASSESGLCATLISRVLLPALLIGNKATLPVKTAIQLYVTVFAELLRALQSSCQTSRYHDFHDLGKKEWKKPESQSALPTVCHRRQPDDSSAKQNDLSNNSGHKVTRERSHSLLR